MPTTIAYQCTNIKVIYYRGDEEALKLLESLLDSLRDESDIESAFDMSYALVAAMSGNEKLIRKVRDIIVTDKRTRWNGDDVEPPSASLAHYAARVCSLTLEGFPLVEDYEYDEETQKKVHDWLKDNPVHKFKPDAALKFFADHIGAIMYRADEARVAKDSQVSEKKDP